MNGFLKWVFVGSLMHSIRNTRGFSSLCFRMISWIFKSSLYIPYSSVNFQTSNSRNGFPYRKKDRCAYLSQHQYRAYTYREEWMAWMGDSERLILGHGDMLFWSIATPFCGDKDNVYQTLLGDHTEGEGIVINRRSIPWKCMIRLRAVGGPSIE